MDSSHLSKHELKQLRRLQELERSNIEKRQGMVKWISIVVASVLFLGFFTFLIVSSKQKKQETQAAALTATGMVRGEEGAPVTLVEFSDLQCPSCQAAEPMVQQILTDYKGKVKLLYKHFPLTAAHPHALEASIVAEAAGKQGKFWEMHDLLFEKQNEWAVAADAMPLFEGYAVILKIDIEQFKKDIADKALEDKVRAQQDEGIKAGVNSTPTFFVNNKLVDYSGRIESIKQAIDNALPK